MAQKPHDAARRKLISAARQARQHLPGWLPPALFLTDPGRTPDPVAVAEQLPPGWGIVYRHYGARHRVWMARQLADIANRRGLALLISADPALAIQVGAAGVHWPFAARRRARKWQGRFDLMTVSAHGSRELRQLKGHVFDAAIVSAVFPSGSASAGRPLGAVNLRGLARQSGLPVYALGGINAKTAGRVSGSAGLAAIEGIVRVFRRPGARI